MAKFLLILKSNEGEELDFAEISLNRNDTFQCKISPDGEIFDKIYSTKRV